MKKSYKKIVKKSAMKRAKFDSISRNIESNKKIIKNYFSSKILTCFLLLPFLWNLTYPSIKANKVSSFPLPTFNPG